MTLVAALTPITAAPRRIVFFSGNLARQRLGAFLIFSMVPTALFWMWFLLETRHQVDARFEAISYALPIASLWIALGPLCMQHGEFLLERYFAVFSRDAGAADLDLSEVQKSISAIDRWYFRTSVPLAVIVPLAFLVTFPQVQTAIGASEVWRYLGAVVFAQVGFVAGSGIWGVVKVLRIAVSVAAIARDPDRSAALRWQPFRPTQKATYASVYTTIGGIGVIFSLGSLVIPMLLAVLPALHPVAQVVVIFFVGLFFIGGLVVFIVPVHLLHLVLEEQKRGILDEIADDIESVTRTIREEKEKRSPELTLHYQELGVFLQLRAAVAAESPLPPAARVISRSVATLILPIALTILQIVA